MKTSNLLALTSLLSTSLALPLALPQTTAASSNTSDPIPWTVYNYTEFCSPGRCTYHFNISYPSGNSEPAFDTHCIGNDVTGALQACDDEDISANEVSGVDNVTVVIQHKYTLNGAEYWITGNTTIVPWEVTTFEVVQSEEWAVA